MGESVMWLLHFRCRLVCASISNVFRRLQKRDDFAYIRKEFFPKTLFLLSFGKRWERIDIKLRHMG